MLDFSLVGVGNLLIDNDQVLSASNISAIVTKDDISGFTTIDSLSDYALSSSLSNYLSKVDGGSISGDVVLLNSNLKIANGNIEVDGHIAGGTSSIANGENTFAFGKDVSALSDYAFAEGLSTYASGIASFAGGYQTSAIGDRSYSEGSKTTAAGNKSHAEGGSSYALGEMSHAEGEMVSAMYRGAHAEGKSTVAYMYSHAEGSQALAGYDLYASNAVVQGDIASHAEGYQTSAIAKYSHAEGFSTLAGIPDASFRPIIADDPVFRGERDFRIDQAAHAEGYQTSAFGKASHAAGIHAVATNDYSYVWNGNPSALYNPNKGNGTFCINPEKGISGLYIGTQSLAQHIQNSGGGISPEILDNKLDKLHVIYPEDYNPDEEMDGSILNTNAIIAHGYNVEARGDYSIATGSYSHATERHSIAIGDHVESSGEKSIAIGNNLSVNSNFALSFGSSNSIRGNGENIIIVGENNSFNSTKKSYDIFAGGISNIISLAAAGPSFVYGRSNMLSNSGLNFIAGEKLSSTQNWSTALGYYAKTTALRQFVWSGVYGRVPYAPNANSGSFNINPENGLSGFCIGNNNFIECVLNAIQLMSDQQKDALRSALGI